MNPIKILSLMFFSLLLAVAAFGEVTFPEISRAELQTAMQSKKVVLLDCNGSESFLSGHIPGAIDFEASKAKLGPLLPNDKDFLVVAYCGGPQCLAYQDGARAMAALGYTNVRHFSPGLAGWAAAKLPLEK